MESSPDQCERSDRDFTAELVRDHGQHAGDRFASRRPGGGVGRMGVHHTADLWHVLIDVRMCGGVGGGRMVAFDQMGLQICDDHVRGRQIVVAHSGWLDHQQFAAGHTRRHIARGPDHQRVPGRWSCRSATSPRMRWVCGYPSAPRNHLEALAARRLLKMSKATANSKTKPLMNDWTSVPRPSSDMPLLRTPMIRPPIKAPVTVPMTPVTAAPPMKTAAMASSSKPVPAPGSAELLRAVNVIPAMAARKPMLTKSQKSTLLVFTPDSCAASRLPPRAYTCLPKTLRFITVE